MIKRKAPPRKARKNVADKKPAPPPPEIEEIEPFAPGRIVKETYNPHRNKSL